MELIKGKWYKNLGKMQDHIGKFDGWYSLNIISVSEYIYKGKLCGYSECFTEDYKFAKECPLSEIQQYLPKGHPDKEFVLPEKWRVKDCEEVSKWASKIFGCGHFVNSDAYLCIDKKEFPKFNSYFFYNKDSALDYTEITLEQFKKYVLKTKEMEEKEIIGYKLKEDCEKFEEAAVKIVQTKCYDKKATTFKELDDVKVCTFYVGSLSKELLENAGVLNLWFEPVFKEEFKVGDWVYAEKCKNDCRNNEHIPVFQVKQITASLDSLVGRWLRPEKDRPTGAPSANCRLATPEEIKKTLVEEAIKRVFTKGAKIKAYFPDYSPVYSSDRPYEMNDGLPEYEQHSDALRMGGSVIYHKGKWAEILPSYPQIEINGYKGEFFDDYVKFGCAKISREVFIDSNKLFKHNSESVFGYTECNRRIESITIGKGTFSKDQIKLIADYYLNKK